MRTGVLPKGATAPSSGTLARIGGKNGTLSGAKCSETEDSEKNSSLKYKSTV